MPPPRRVGQPHDSSRGRCAAQLAMCVGERQIFEFETGKPIAVVVLRRRPLSHSDRLHDGRFWKGVWRGSEPRPLGAERNERRL